MSDFLVAIGLVLVIEGLLYAALPDAMKHMMIRVITMPSWNVRFGGLFAMLLGVVIVYFVRS